ncbi:MAG: aspartate aminotransferase family protein [Actinomycetia bacterium]|nr:aspartate aminotransferase family protein [Actinomycetes bacterium]MCP5030975.1 aspartate aminotransferase family protein [Actinomycetes bacterium]
MAVPKLLHPYAVPAREDYVTFVEGDGATVTDSTGKTYIDALASLWYVQAGHGCQPIIDATTAQMNKLATFHTFERFSNEPSEALAAKIVEVSPFDDARVFLANSGSESIDTAIKLARASHVRAGQADRTIIVTRDRAYHGVNYGGTSAQGIPLNKEGWGPLLPDFVQVPADDLEALATLFTEHGNRIAAVITEPVQGAAGVHPPPDGYLEGLRRLCTQHGAYLVFDEVICGFGRLGAWTAAEYFNVIPDMITFAKGVSSGYVPVAGVLMSQKVLDPLEDDSSWMLRHGYTYSGHPAAAAAAVANLEVLGDGLIERAAKVGARLSEGLKSLAEDGVIAEVRGAGAVWAAQLNDGVDAVAARDAMMDRGVIPRPIGTSIAFCPPLVITDEQIDTCIDVLAEVAGGL